MSYAANIPKFYLYKALRFPLLWLPIYVVFFQEGRGFTLAQIGIIDAVFWLANALGEVPTGAIADRYGRKTSMLLGTAIYTVSIGLVAVAESFPFVLLAYLGWGIALTMTSGADEALLYESLQAEGRGKDYTRVNARVMMIETSARSVGSVVGALLAGIALALPFTMSAVLGVATFAVLLTLKEPQAASDMPRASYNTIMRDALRLVRTRPLMRWALFYLAIVPLGPFIILFVYIQPYALEVGFSVQALGLLVMVMNLVTIAGAGIAPRLSQRYGEVSVLLAVPPLLLMGLVALAMGVNMLGLVVIGAVALVQAVIRPIVMTIVHREVSDSARATVVSLGSLAFTLLLALFSPIYGWLADTVGLNAVFAVMALTLGGTMLAVLFMRRPQFLASSAA